jgi:cyclopropane fatty-acyl-phospholipid synthase-like methyltransferase
MKRYEKYDFDEFADYFSGPDAFMLTDELTAAMHLTSEMKVLDLGCGNALSSLFLVKEYGCKVYAVDPKSASSNNYDLAVKYQVADKLIPFCAVADRLPFAPDSFDAMICINAWQAFGTAPGFFAEKIAPYLKKGAQIGIVTPAVTAAYESESRIDQQDVLATYWSARRWGDFFRNEFDVKEVKEMDSTVEAWKRWYRAASPAARRDETAKWDIGNTIAIAMVTGTVR